MSNQQLSTNTFGCAKWIVSPTASDGTHTTIAASIASASSGDTIFIRPGTYTENLTLKAGVNLTAYDCDSFTPNVTISGELTVTFTGVATISGINLQTNSNYLLSSSGTNSSTLYLSECFLNCLNNTGISCSNPNASITFNNCRGNIATTGITLFAVTAGFLEFQFCEIDNSGNSTTSSALSDGHIEFNWCAIFFPITTTSTARLGMRWSVHDTVAINTTCLTLGGSDPHLIQQGSVLSGSASAISISNTTSLNQVAIYSTNTNCVTGSGTVTYFALLFTGTSSLINTTTQVGGLLQGGVAQAPSAGFIGEQISSAMTNIATTSNSAKTIASISLTPGIWDISAISYAQPAGGTGIMQAHILGISTTDNTLTGNSGDDQFQTNETATVLSGVVPVKRATLTTTTNYYAVVLNIYTSTTCPTNARITATRVG